MQLTEKQQRNVDLINAIYERCHDDASFKARLIANPESTIKEIQPDFSVSNGKELVVQDQTESNKIYLNIPAKINLEDAELTEEQMELVAGGQCTVHVSWWQFIF